MSFFQCGDIPEELAHQAKLQAEGEE